MAMKLWFSLARNDLEMDLPTVDPAGLIYLHSSGESDPWTHHPHYNILIGGVGYDAARQRVASIGPKWLPLEHLKAWRNFLCREAWGINHPDVQGHWEYRDNERSMAHALRYAVRSQGDQNPRARWHWTKERLRMLRPFGMLATGKVKAWKSVNPWPSKEEKAATLGWAEVGLDRCRKCRQPLRDLTPGK